MIHQDFEKFPGIAFVHLVSASDEIKESVRTIRNEDSVRSKMFSTHVISREEHLEWINDLQGNKRRIVWAVKHLNKVCGAVSLYNLESIHRSADWEFYLTASKQGQGLGGIVEFILLDIAFELHNVEKLNCEVLETNQGVVRMHKKFGFREEGIRRKNVIVNGQRVDVNMLGLLADEWSVARTGIKPLIERVYQSIRNVE